MIQPREERVELVNRYIAEVRKEGNWIMQDFFQDVRPDVMTSCTQNIQYECLVFCDCTINGNLCMIDKMIEHTINQ